MTRVKKAEKLFHIDVVKSISFIDHNRVRFIVYGVNDVFRIYFKEYIKEKEKHLKHFISGQLILKIIQNIISNIYTLIIIKNT